MVNFVQKLSIYDGEGRKLAAAIHLFTEEIYRFFAVTALHRNFLQPPRIARNRTGTPRLEGHDVVTHAGLKSCAEAAEVLLLLIHPDVRLPGQCSPALNAPMTSKSLKNPDVIISYLTRLLQSVEDV